MRHAYLTGLGRENATYSVRLWLDMLTDHLAVHVRAERDNSMDFRLIRNACLLKG